MKIKGVQIYMYNNHNKKYKYISYVGESNKMKVICF